MFLMIMALGAIAQKDDISNGLYLAEKYAHPAFSMLHVVMLDGSLTAVHCLILYVYDHYLYLTLVYT
jgi:hypothetical protein